MNHKETPTINCTLAFRTSIVVLKSDRFAQHQIYNVFYGSARIRCILWWIFPEDGKNHDRSERKYKFESYLPPKPSKVPGMAAKVYKTRLREYKLERETAKKTHAQIQAQAGIGFDRPARPKWRKVTAILLPLAPYDIETYKPSAFEKNYRGKVMLTEKGSVIGVGRVDRVLSRSAETYTSPKNQGK